MDGPWDIDPDEEEAMIAEQAEHDAEDRVGQRRQHGPIQNPNLGSSA